MTVATAPAPDSSDCEPFPMSILTLAKHLTSAGLPAHVHCEKLEGRGPVCAKHVPRCHLHMTFHGTGADTPSSVLVEL